MLLANMLESKSFLFTSVLLVVVLFKQVKAQGNSSCLNHGITVCCTHDHCPTQISPDGCYCDDSCDQFGDCCDDINEVCPKESCNETSIRLVDGANSGADNTQGRVEVCVDGRWGSVCHYGWNNADAQVVCAQLNHPNSGAKGLKNARFQEGSGAIHMSDVACSGDETSLFDCQFSNTTSKCNHGMDASVICGVSECTDGSLRLAGGFRDSEGRVEVCIDGTWGTVCDDAWDRNDALVVCKQLNLKTDRVLAYHRAYFGAGKGPINMNDVQCTGRENSLTNCSFNENNHCSHNEDAGVICGLEQGCIDGSVRLEDGANNTEGRVEVCIKGAWNTICDEGWDVYAARVICREIGLPHAGAIPFNGGYFESGSGLTSVYFTNVTCTGHENSILGCDYITPSVCPHSRDAGVRCSAGPGECTNNAIRLVDGPDEGQGRVEVCQFERWGTICDNRWSTQHAEVVCRQLGLPELGAAALSGAYYGAGTGPIHMDDVICTGNEANLTQCSFTSNEGTSCSHSNDAGVRCPCVQGDIRLANSVSPLAGRVEVCVGGVWGTVTDDGWNSLDSNVVCRQLGYWDNVSFPLLYASYGAGSGPIHIDFARCTGEEERLIDCTYNFDTSRDSHNEDAAVICFNGIGYGSCFDGSVRLVGGRSAQEGRVEACIAGAWGMVCQNNWDSEDAAVVCSQLGYPRIGTAYGGGVFLPGNRFIFLRSTACQSSHSSLLECPFSTDALNRCNRFQSAGVQCYESEGCIHGDVRLNGTSLNDNEGRVEVCYNGVWGTVTSVGFDDREAKVVCNQLGYFQYLAIPRLNAYYGTGSGPIALNNLRCVGNEDSLTDCANSVVPYTTGHALDAGVYCYTDNNQTEETCTLGNIRLADGDAVREGRVEVCLNGEWTSVCGNGLTTEGANVVCRQLGYSGYGSIALPDSYFKNTNVNQSMSIRRLSCVGHEYGIWECFTTATGVCANNIEASVRCQPKQCNNGEIRLVGGNNELEGRVEVCLNGTWGTVCDDFWSHENSVVICKQLGYSDNFALGYNSAFFGSGVGLPILVDNLQCVGNETSFTRCAFETHTSDCTHTEDVGVKCYNSSEFTGSGGECSHGEIRLVNGSSPLEGRIELCIDDQWGTVCNDRFHFVDGIVACRQLGFSDLGAAVITDGRYGYGDESLPIFIDNALCFGEEDKLLDCLFDPHTADCDHDGDVGVKCVPKGQCEDGDIRLVNGSRSTEGRVEVCFGGVWGTIAAVGTRFDNTAAHVACRQLGYSDKYALPMGPSFGSGEGPVHAYSIQCQGDEPSVLNCTHLKVPLNVINPHVADVGVRCFNLTDAPCTPGEIRLVNGSLNTSTALDGRVEVCLDGIWGTLCGDFWIEDDSRVVCNQLGYSKYAALTLPLAHYGLGNITTDEVSVHFVPICSGTESNIMECQLFHIDSCTHYSDTAVRCFKDVDCTEGDTRLVSKDGSVGNEGRLEVCQHNIWGTVCEDFFSRFDARVTCRELGYSELYATTFVGAYYGEGTGPIHLDNVQCIGNEDSILDCIYDSVTDDCTHRQDVGVACYNESQCDHGSVRLVNGNYSYEGRVEYCLNGIWGSICDTFWDFFDAITICQQLGLTATYAVGYTDAYYGEGQSEIVLNAVDCLNQEPNINFCFRSLAIQNCIHSQDASVACFPERQCPNEGDVRLLDGGSDLEGRVEVCLNGVWGSIASFGWDTNDAIVVCKQLGYIATDAVAIGFGQFGQTNGRINMQQVRCTGQEANLAQCTYNGFTVYNDHSQDAGVRCYQTTNCSTGDIRLVGGADNVEGRAEICVDNTWGTVNNVGWTNTESRVVCDQLGYSNEVAFIAADFGGGTGPISLSNVDCQGDEGFLLNCSLTLNPQLQNHNQDVGVKCFNESDSNTTCENGDVRVFGGNTEYEGTVEVCLNGVWGSICYFGWDANDAKVICNQLGFAATTNPQVYAAFYGQSSGPILLGGIGCDGTESSIADCPVDVSPSSVCTHFHDAGVRCLEKSCVEDSVRLVGGSTPAEGRVEICSDGIWGTVCDDNWKTSEARVICRQLGYSDAVGIAYTHGVFGHGTGPIAIRGTQCTGRETNITACQYSAITTGCSHGNDAGVKCYNISGPSDVCSTGSVRLVGGGSELQGSVEVCLGNEWGTVCDDQWDSIDSGIVCAQLGYPQVSTVFNGGFFDSIASAIHLDDLECRGSESSILHCPFDYRVTDCTHAKDAGVKCYERTNCTDGQVRLVGGPASYEGRLEMCFFGVWGTVQGSNPLQPWSETQTRVVCTQLKFGPIGSAPGNGSYGISSGPVAISNVVCQGNERALVDCQFDIRTTGLEHKHDVAVRCAPPPPLCVDGAVRLVNGSVPHHGRVEVCINETWGTVTDDFWSFSDGVVVCRQLGFSEKFLTVRNRAYFGQGTGPIFLDLLRCSGIELTLLQCPYLQPSILDTHSEDAGVECSLTNECTHGAVRLANGTVASEGRVEVCIEGTWGTVNGRDWTSTDARVLCGELGYSKKYAVPVQGMFGSVAVHLPIIVNRLFCTGRESKLLDCTYSTSGFGLHTQDAGVECYSEEKVGNCTFGDVRLVEGNTKYEGRVEVCINGDWGSVCNEGWTLPDARVTCRQLGFTATGAEIRSGGTFGSGQGEILFRSVECDGDEASILDCPHNSNLGLCTHASDAGVVCHPGDGCVNGEVRLIGNNTYEGRVEVCLDNVWGTVCHDYWSTNDARVVCNQLGLPSDYPVPFRQAFFGTGNIPIVVDNIVCDGTEGNLTECRYDFDTSDCTHLDDAGVACLAEAQCSHGQVRLVNGTTINSMAGRVETCLNGVWGTVCDNAFSLNEAAVVCDALTTSKTYPVHYQGAYFGEGTGPIFYEFVDCNGRESNLTECDVAFEVDCDHSQDVGVACLTKPECESNGDIRLVNGAYPGEGRLEVCFDKIWGTVSDNIFDDISASTICNILGYRAGGLVGDITQYGSGVGPIHMDNLFCDTTDVSILECGYSRFTTFNDHSNDIAVTCYKPDNCSEGEVRLVDGTNDGEGRLEVCDAATWGTVADFFYFDANAARVVCRQLGYSGKVALPYFNSYFGFAADGPFSSPFECTGDESNVAECDQYSLFFYSHFNDVGVKCFNESVMGNCSVGSVRLAGGNSTNDGRVEVCLDGQWGSICTPNPRTSVANVICRSLDFAFSGATVSTASTNNFGISSGPIAFSNVFCPSDATTIFDCTYNGDVSSCSHLSDLGVICKMKECNHGDVRLVAGNSSNEGRLEVCVGGQWGTVCDDRWDHNDAIVICNQLGYNSTYAQPYHFNHFTGATIPIAIDSMSCEGTEKTWTNCSYSTLFTQFCSHTEDAGLRCFNEIPSAACTTGDHRLVGGAGDYEGRIEVCINGRWSSVCAQDYWYSEDATVACRAAYNTTGVNLIYPDGYFGEGSGPIYVTDISCAGSESSLLDCDHSASTTFCDHSYDVGVRCILGDECNVTGAVRLQNGSSLTEGRVEICSDGVWGTVSDTSFGFTEAIIVCKQLGYSPYYAEFFSSSKFGPGDGVVHLVNPFCLSTHTNLLECSSTFFSFTPTSHQNDVGVRCFEMNPEDNCTLGTARLVNGTQPTEGRVEICVNYEWGTVATLRWDVYGARTACYQAGFAGPGAEVLEVSPGTGPVHLSNIDCFSGDDTLFTCSRSSSLLPLSHEYDVGAKCLPSDNCTEGAIRLSDGDLPSSGIVEVCLQSAWSTISDDFAGTSEGQVICNTLGYPGLDSYYFRGAQGPTTNLPIGITFLYCSFFDETFSDCTWFFTRSIADHADDFGVVCQTETISSTTTSLINAPSTESSVVIASSTNPIRISTTSSAASLPGSTSNEFTTSSTIIISAAKSVIFSASSTNPIRISTSSSPPAASLPGSTSNEFTTSSTIIISAAKTTTVNSVTKATTTSAVSTLAVTTPLPSSAIKSITSTSSVSSSAVTVPLPSSAVENTLEVTISGNFDSTTFPQDNFKRSVAESANQYCESTSQCQKKRQASRVSPEDVIIVSVTDAPNGGVSVTFYVMSDSDRETVIPADALYEAVKMGIEEGVFEEAGFDSIVVEPPTSSVPNTQKNTGMTSGAQAGIAITVIVIVLIAILVVVVLILILWMKRKNQNHQLDEEHILSRTESMISNRSSVVEIDTKPSENEYITTVHSASMPVNEKLEFKKLEEEIDTEEDPKESSFNDKFDN